MPPTRRALLASTASALTGIAGCLWTSSGDDSSTAGTTGRARTEASRTTDTVRTTDTFEPSESTGEESTTPATEDFEISFVGHAVQRSAFWPRNADVTSVWAPADRQLLFAMVTVEGGRPRDVPLERFSVSVGEHSVDHAETVADGDNQAWRPEPDGCDCPDEYDAYARFPLPAPLSAERGEVVWDGPESARTWSLPGSALSSLAAPTTTFELGEVETPSSTRPREAYDVTYEVENVGEETGIARGALSQEGPLYGVLDTAAEEVAPGEALTRRVGVEHPGATEGSEAALALSTVGGAADWTVPVEGTGTTARG